MEHKRPTIVAVVGPTASGKTAKAVELALERNGEVISVDSRQVYRMLNVGTEKISTDEMRGVTHHLIDIRDPEETYSAADFVEDATKLINEIIARGKLPILAGGTHFYIDALINGLPADTPPNPKLRALLEARNTDDLFAELQTQDPRRAEHVDPKNRRRVVRALEIVAARGTVPERTTKPCTYEIEWVVLDPSRDLLRERLNQREMAKFPRGLVDEVRRVRAYLVEKVGQEAAERRLDEFGLEYRIVGEYLRGEREESSLLPTLSSKLWQYAKHQKKWLRKLAPQT